MTEPSLKELFDGIAAERHMMRAEAPKLLAIAARLREGGLDDEAKLLEAHVRRMGIGFDALAHLADGMLEETAVMDAADFASEQGEG